MFFKNLARFPDIGSNSYLLDFGETRVVLDAGTHPKHTGRNTLPRFEEIEPDSVDAIFVSHPHLDHIGGLPVLMQQQISAAVAMTAPTRESGAALLHNSVNIMKSQKEELNEPAYPLYSHRRVNEYERLWFTRETGEAFSIGSADRVECQFFPAGHVQGAVGIRMEGAGHTVFYTGDVHFEDQTLTRAAEFPTEGIDTLIVETTRGGYERDPGYTREKEKERLGKAIRETIERGGAVLVPVFAFGKTQELLFMLQELREAGLIPHVPVHIGGLSTRMSQIADRFSDSNERLHTGTRLLDDFDDLHILPRGHLEPEFQPGRIYALSSGMMSEHTVSNRFARHILRSEHHSLIFVGYADSETPAGKILEVGQGGRVQLDKKRDHESEIKCEVHRFDFSGHAPRHQIADYAVACRPKNVILVHGDPAARAWFQEELTRRLPEARIILPEPGEEITLS
ncbi:MAG: MBL fold metallo-hydrolase [Verrucomicrobiales bacterium]|nr:MBL fold metallo-hydrolase [Verrucomicrobiales bacterium]